MPYVRGKIDRFQMTMMPLSFDDLIKEDNPVRVLDAFVDGLDVQVLGFKFAKIKNISRPAYDPRDMIKIYLYGYYNGQRSSRKLERECARNIELMWLVNGIIPDARTICNFRHDNHEALIDIFKQFGLLCRELDLMSRELVAVDGSRFRASNSRQKSYTKGKLKKLLDIYEKHAKEYMSILDAEDQIIDTTDRVIAKEELDKTMKRIAELKAMQVEVAEKGEINLTDPDCRHMSASNNGTDLAYNMQLVVEDRNHFIVCVDTVNATTDNGQLYSMATQAKEALDVEEITVLGDKGYFSTDEIEKCEESGITPIISVPRTTSPTGDERYAKDKFIYDEETNTFTCPLGKTLRRKQRDKCGIKYICKDCHSCPEKKNCTRGKGCRTVTLGYNEETLSRARERQIQNMELYRRRQQLAEHPTGTIKRALGYTYYLTRGLKSVNVESHLHALAYNLKRFIHILGVKTALEMIKQGQTLAFFTISPTFHLFLLITQQKRTKTFST